MKNKIAWTGTLAVLLAFAFNAQAGAFQSSMTVTGPTNQPIGHYDFCKQYADECRATPVAAPMVLTEDSWRQILQVNFEVNSAVQPLTDMEIYGVEERWAYPETVGDCEDYVLLKRKKLIEAGIAQSNLLITVVLQPNGDGHAVLTVRTDRGDLVLDNMRDKVLVWSETEYRFLKRQSEKNAGKWVKLEDGRATVAVGSVRK
ncbi:predicted transglutaminase-like cysteine proteinase [Rhizobium subbaraonis]|uniref:Predicted transglutaminase-like cysteine proteinase n=1 Tax=Rhizobium subbaraonis TaxID=908946 RepID=A0A285UAG6_9HYPH|nr:transglutaminase-like cysteine peptidase [Rhizobium subbaraonis]SOC38904.1 predicted transglutaminase-like cysteine proteinase [Rhizobium subbaraonis]